MPIRVLQDYRAVRKVRPPAATPADPQPPAVTDPQVRDPVISTPRHNISPFKCLDIWPSINGKTVITWQQNDNFRDQIPDDTELALEFSYTGNPDSWLLVKTCPITYYLTDSANRFRGQSVEGIYRIKLKGSDFEYISPETSLFSKLSFTEYRTALKIIRAENRNIYHKSPGYLLKRRHLGIRCNKCTNSFTNTAMQEQCPICFGTGFIGGYFQPIQCGMEITLSGSGDKVDPHRGPINDGQIQGRITALFCPEQNDVWVDSISGSRYRVVSHEVICHERSVPLVLMTQLKHIPTSDIVYSFEVKI